MSLPTCSLPSGIESTMSRRVIRHDRGSMASLETCCRITAEVPSDDNGCNDVCAKNFDGRNTPYRCRGTKSMTCATPWDGSRLMIESYCC